MKKTAEKKKTRLSQYTNLMAEKGITFHGNILYGFKFNTLAESYAFHYTLMENKVNYLLYDGVDEKVKIIAIEDVDKIREVALKYNGTEYKPSIIDDYA